MTTKATESAHVYVVRDVSIETAGEQNLDTTEEIEVVVLSPEEIDHMIISGEICDAVAMADWSLLRHKHPEFLEYFFGAGKKGLGDAAVAEQQIHQYSREH